MRRRLGCMLCWPQYLELNQRRADWEKEKSKLNGKLEETKWYRESCILCAGCLYKHTQINETKKGL